MNINFLSLNALFFKIVTDVDFPRREMKRRKKKEKKRRKKNDF
jgi:hypothetical protein